MGRRRKSGVFGSERFSFGGKRPPAHKNKARISHNRLQFEDEKYDNDYIETYYEDEDGELIFNTTGVNKKSYKLHDPDFYDELKDGE